MTNLRFGEDQADKLREIVNNLNEKPGDAAEPEIEKETVATRLIAVTSGKGGVGKTSFTVNLAIWLKKLGNRVLIIDGDLGLANIEVLLGVVPKSSLNDYLNSDIPLSQIINLGPAGIQFISGGSGITGLANLDRGKFKKIIEIMSKFDSYVDYILVDTGAGISRKVTNFMLAVKEVILVTNPEPTSITDAYAMLKVMKTNNHRCDVKLVVNRVQDAAEAQEIMDKIGSVARKFLDIEVNNLGYILDDRHVSRAVKLQEPFVLRFPGCKAAKNIEDIAERLALNGEFGESGSDGVRNFLNRLYGLLSSVN